MLRESPSEGRAREPGKASADPRTEPHSGRGAAGDGAAAVIGGEDCTPSYRNNEGQPSPTGRQAAPYAPGPIAFFKLLADWREAGTFEGLEFGP